MTTDSEGNPHQRVPATASGVRGAGVTSERRGLPPDDTSTATLPQTQPGGLAVTDASNELWCVVLAGGIGSRFWPLSSARTPKQLLPLVDDRPLIADTLRRFSALVPPERVLVMTSRDIGPAIHEAIPEVPIANMLAEPAPIGTAASLAWGLAEIKRRSSGNAMVCVTHADLAISFLELFHNAVLQSVALAAHSERIVLLGVQPTRSETGFGYISWTSDPNNNTAAHRVTGFIEKPGHIMASALRANGALWHSGMCIARVGALESELRQHTPEVLPALDIASQDHLDRLAPHLISVSIERGLLERSTALAVLPVDFTWDDIGTWASLRRARELDDSGNGVVGRAHLVDASSNIVHSTCGSTVLYGVDNLLVVRLNGLTLVTTMERAKDLRRLMEALPENVRKRAPE